jgi:hypothetical protein
MTFEEVEKARQEYAKKLKPALIIIGSLFGLSIILFIIGLVRHVSSGLMGISAILFFVATIAAVILIFLFRKEATAYQEAFKNYFVEQNLKRIFTDVKYNHAEGMPCEVLKSTGMIRTGDVYHSNDLVHAKYKDVQFSQADVHIQERYTDSDGNTQYVTLFKGRWMVFEFPRPFTFRLQVVQKWFNAAKKAKKDRELKRKIKRIETESITFNKKFKVYAEDDFEAYYILDPSFINQIENLSEATRGKLMLCFIDNKLHVAIFDNKDAFEAPSVFKTIDEKAETEKINHEIKTITDYVDFLKLDRKLFTGKQQ